MEIIRTPLAPQHEKIVIKIPVQDFLPQYEEELRKYRQKANLKGFRKGKAPGDYVKKLVGKALLAEVVEKKLESSMRDFITEQKLSILGQPLLVTEDHPINHIDPFELTDHEYHFELGYAPELELRGISKDDVYTMHLVEVQPSEVEKRLQSYRSALGKLIETTEPIGENDTLEIDAQEMVDGEVKEGGFVTYFVTSMKDLNEEIKPNILGQKQGYTFDANIFELEKNRTEEYVKKYLLNLDENEQKDIQPTFKMKIAKVKSQQLAELNEEFYEQAFGKDKVHNQEEAEAHLKEMIANSTKKSSEALLFREIQDRLMENNPVELPDTFLKKWLASKEGGEKTLAQYDIFQKNLHWTLIRDQIIKMKNVQVTKDDIQRNIMRAVFRYMGGQNSLSPDQLWNVVNRLMEDEEQVSRAHEEVLTDKLFDVIVEDITVENNYITEEEFKEKMDLARQTATPEIDDAAIADVKVDVEEVKEDHETL